MHLKYISRWLLYVPIIFQRLMINFVNEGFLRLMAWISFKTFSTSVLIRLEYNFNLEKIEYWLYDAGCQKFSIFFEKKIATQLIKNALHHTTGEYIFWKLKTLRYLRLQWKGVIFAFDTIRKKQLIEAKTTLKFGGFSGMLSVFF